MRNNKAVTPKIRMIRLDKFSSERKGVHVQSGQFHSQYIAVRGFSQIMEQLEIRMRVYAVANCRSLRYNRVR